MRFITSFLFLFPLSITTTLSAETNILPGMTRAASNEISVQTFRDQSYTIKIAQMLDVLRREFLQRFQASASAGNFEAVIFRTKNDFQSYVSSKKIGVIPDRGAYFPTLRAVLVPLGDSDEAEVLKTLIHEVIHHFNSMVHGITLPWFDEGVAMYFQESDFRKIPVVLGVFDPAIVNHLKSSLEKYKLVSLATLVNMEYAAFHIKDIEQERLHYDESWAVIHFLIHASERIKPADGIYFRTANIYLLFKICIALQLHKAQRRG